MQLENESATNEQLSWDFDFLCRAGTKCMETEKQTSTCVLSTFHSFCESGIHPFAHVNKIKTQLLNLPKSSLNTLGVFKMEVSYILDANCRYLRPLCPFVKRKNYHAVFTTVDISVVFTKFSDD